MNVYDKAYELSKAIKSSEEYKSLKQAKEKVKNDPKVKEMYDELMDFQENFRNKQMQGEDIAESEIEQFQKKFEIASMHSDMQSLFDAERRFSVMFDDVQKIIYDAVIKE
jgi:cell fate (sporulation/competence/biofilm development) regulator YlbF (YheA/YmcA/DUF963 family)